MSTADLDDQLAPVRQALLDHARQEGERLVAAARADADATVRDADDEVARAVEDARRRADATARARRASELVRARRERQAALLRAQAEWTDRLRAAIRSATATFPDDPRYPALVVRLEQLARRQLGDGASIEHPTVGGVTASVPGRRVDYGLPALAERAFGVVAEEAGSPWA
jgi:vacuolar-type H+-ATPase subunit E/Vma4